MKEEQRNHLVRVLNTLVRIEETPESEAVDKAHAVLDSAIDNFRVALLTLAAKLRQSTLEPLRAQIHALQGQVDAIPVHENDGGLTLKIMHLEEAAACLDAAISTLTTPEHDPYDDTEHAFHLLDEAKDLIIRAMG